MISRDANTDIERVADKRREARRQGSCEAGRPGQLTDQDGRLALCVEDDGEGFDLEEVRKTSSGLQLVLGLARQLRGTFASRKAPRGRASSSRRENLERGSMTPQRSARHFASRSEPDRNPPLPAEEARRMEDKQGPPCVLIVEDDFLIAMQTEVALTAAGTRLSARPRPPRKPSRWPARRSRRSP